LFEQNMQRTGIIPLLLLLILLTAAIASAQQQPTVLARWHPVGGDSLRVEYLLPDATGRPAVIVLSDRYGLQENVRSTLKVFSRLGFRAFAVPLLSAPEHPFTAIPAAVVDSGDVARVTRVAVDIANEDGCNGMVFLLGYDVGANVAIELIARFPFFKGAALFYPTGGAVTLRRLLEANCEPQLHIAQFDPDCTLADVNALREGFMEDGKKLQVSYYKDAKRFFFNPEHPDYHKSNTQEAWKQINSFFRSQ
jgi:dienelactone hydrolase